MSKRLNDLLGNQSQLLTGIAQGYSNDSYVGTLLFPEIAVDSINVTIPEYAKDSLRIFKTERGLRASSNIISPGEIKNTAFNLEEHDLAFPIDWREMETNKQQLDLESYAATTTADGLMLKREDTIAKLVQDPNNYASSNKITIASGTSKWTHADSTPITDMLTGIAAVRTGTGRYANTVIIGASAFQALKTNKQVQEYLKYTGKVLTTEVLASILDVTTVAVGQSVYVNESTGSFADVWGDNVVIAHVAQRRSDQRSIYIPSFGYSLTYRGFPLTSMPTPVNGNPKVKAVTTTTLTKQALLLPSAGYLIRDVI